MAASKAKDFPDGISGRNLQRAGGSRLSWYRTLALGAFLLIAIFGIFGGAPTASRKVVSEAAELSVHVPHPIRNGMFLEWRIEVLARQPVEDAVIAVPENLWKDMTINSLIPAATEEEFKDGEFRFHFGPLEPGDRLLFKIDGQVNPPNFERHRGAIRVLDRERQLAASPVALRVIP